nr:MAG TPA: hypothetical protein [Microviridae sp.]
MRRLLNVYRIKTFDGDVFIVRREFIGDLLDIEQIHVESCVRCQCLITDLQCPVRVWRWRRIVSRSFVTDYYG